MVSPLTYIRSILAPLKILKSVLHSFCVIFNDQLMNILRSLVDIYADGTKYLYDQYLLAYLSFFITLTAQWGESVVGII